MMPPPLINTWNMSNLPAVRLPNMSRVVILILFSSSAVTSSSASPSAYMHDGQQQRQVRKGIEALIGGKTEQSSARAQRHDGDEAW